MKYIVDYCGELLLPKIYAPSVLSMAPCWFEKIYELSLDEGFVKDGDLREVPSNILHHIVEDPWMKLDFVDDPDVEVLCLTDSAVRNLLKLHAYHMTDSIFYKPFRVILGGTDERM